MRSGLAFLLAIVGLLSASPSSRGEAGASPESGLPRVVLVGDSIRMGYAPRVAARLKGKADRRQPAARMAAIVPTCSRTSTNGSSGRSPTSCT